MSRRERPFCFRIRPMAPVEQEKPNSCLSRFGPKQGMRSRAARTACSTSGGVLWGMRLGARERSRSPALPASRNRRNHLRTVLREQPNSRAAARMPTASAAITIR